MKSVFYIIWLFLGTYTLHAQIDSIPESVWKGFRQTYPDAQKASAKQEGSIFLIDFELEGAVLQASFDLAGDWIETVSDLKLTYLPQAVLLAIQQKYPDFEIQHAQSVNNRFLPKCYALKISDGSLILKVLLDDQGFFID